MITLNNQELMELYGGGISMSVLGFIGAAITFLIGAVDGFLRPFRCR